MTLRRERPLIDHMLHHARRVEPLRPGDALGTFASTICSTGAAAAAVTRLAGVGVVVVGAVLILDRALG
jgi:hypothetical protein